MNADVTLLTSGRESSRRLLFDVQNNLRGWHNRNTGEFRPETSASLSGLTEHAFSGTTGVTITWVLGGVAVVCLILGCVFQFRNHPMTTEGAFDYGYSSDALSFSAFSAIVRRSIHSLISPFMNAARL